MAIFLAPVIGIDRCLLRYRLHSANLTSFTVYDEARMQLRRDSFRAAMDANRSWLQAHGREQGDLAGDILLKRMEVIEQIFTFTLTPPDRLKFFRHLRGQHRLYAALWSPYYRCFNSLSALIGLIFGYHNYHRLRAGYRDSSTLLKLRKQILPATREAKQATPQRHKVVTER
jgi:hypothetical protein